MSSLIRKWWYNLFILVSLLELQWGFTPVSQPSFPRASWTPSLTGKTKLSADISQQDAVHELGTAKITFTLPPHAKGSKEGYPSVLHHIHVQKILQQEEAGRCLEIAKQFAHATGRWGAPDSLRHTSYPTVDFPVDDCSALEEYLEEIDFDSRLFGALHELYGVNVEDMEYIDLFVAHYEANDDDIGDANRNPNAMDRLELHRDGSLLSFSLLLNSPSQFEGGGTFYDALRDVAPSDNVLYSGGVIRPLQEGDACLHCGKILHGADVVTSGNRTVLVGFVDVAERNFRPGSLAKACTKFGRMDVAANRWKRQLKMGNQSWTPATATWRNGSYLKGVVPAFRSVARRGDPNFQRQQKLEAEDAMLREILLPPEERPEPFPFGSEISILEGFEFGD